MKSVRVLAHAFVFTYNKPMLFREFSKIKDSFLSTLPVVAVVLVFYFLYFPLCNNAGITLGETFTSIELIVFGISAVLVILGMWMFGVGVDSSMKKIGEIIGSTITKKQSLVLLIVVFMLFGILITVAEPDLTVLANQVPIDNWVLIICVGIGVGVFVVVGALRIMFQKSLKVWLLAFYGLMFAIACLVEKSLIPLSIDSGGVTTGPITVPFILAIAAGVATSRGGKDSGADSFGLVAFCSIGPIITVLVLMLSMKAGDVSYSFAKSPVPENWYGPFIHSLLPSNSSFGSLISVSISIFPLVIFFLVYEVIFVKLPVKKVLRILSGIIYAYIGLVFFMTAVEAGFLPIGQKLGLALGSDEINGKWLLLVAGAVLGVAAVFAEPAVHVLTDQIETVSDGGVSKGQVLFALAVGNGLAIALSLLRVINPDISILHIVVPGYIVAFLMSFLVPDIYSAIAFDSGGVVSGPMNTTFIMPFAIGACFSLLGEEKILTNAFGTVAVVAMMPLISIQLLGLIAGIKRNIHYKNARERVREEFDDQIIHF